MKGYKQDERGGRRRGGRGMKGYRDKQDEREKGSREREVGDEGI